MPTSVLVVDDEPGLRELLRRWLAGPNEVVLEAQSAEAAMAVLTQTPDVEVALVDLQMPGQGGAWLVNEMRAAFPTVAIVLATADASVPGTISLQPSVIGYLVKPLDRQQVVRLVAEGHAWHARTKAPSAASATDPVETFLDRKLTGNRGHDTDNR
jgi:CheY-like chemotaxis protein